MDNDLTTNTIPQAPARRCGCRSDAEHAAIEAYLAGDPRENMQPQCNHYQWNQRYPVGTPVTVHGIQTVTTTQARYDSERVAVVNVKSYPAALPLSYVDPVRPVDLPPAKEPEIIRFDENSDEVGVLVWPRGDDDLFWRLIARDAVDYDYRYGMDEVAEKAGLLLEDGHTYDLEAVTEWVQANVKPPLWRWWRWQDDFYDQVRKTLATADPGDPGAFYGTVIEVVRQSRG